MAFKAVIGLSGYSTSQSQLGASDLSFKRYDVSCNRVRDSERICSWIICNSFNGLSVHRATRSVEDENSSKQAAELQRLIDQTNKNVPRRLHKDLGPLPIELLVHILISGPLSVTDLSASSNDGSKMRISYKGAPGAYSEDAALKTCPNCETVPCDEFEDAFKAVELWLADKTVLPIETSFAGSSHHNYDLLLHHRLHIVGEVQLACDFCLLARPGVGAEQLKRVLSHPLALAHSDVFLSKLGITREIVDDTAGAAQFVASSDLWDSGVVASARAADIYGLNILAKGIQDDSNNITRFLVLARDPIIPRADRPFKTSIVFTLEEGPAILFKALTVFALRDINLTKIECRPQRKRPLRVVDDSNNGSAKYFDSLFYIDFKASMAETRAQSALAQLQEFTTFLRVLGCYPVDTML